MKIIDLKVNGYRSLKNIHWEPGDLNILIGPNASGKSNLLRCLELISASAKGNLGKYIQGLGGMEPLVWDGALESIGFTLRASPPDENRTADRDSLTYVLELTRMGKGSAYTITKELLANYCKVEAGLRATPLKFIERSRFSASIFDPNEKALIAPPESIPEDDTVLSKAIAPFSGNYVISGFRDQLASWSIYHDVHVNRDAPVRQPTVTRNEKRIDPDGQNLISVLHTLYTTDRAFKGNLNSAMTAAFGDDFDELVFPPAADQRIQLRLRWKSLNREQSAADLSDGTLRFLFLLAVLASPSPSPVIAIDEPETGLHPSMFPVIAEHAIDASERAQIILSTHSPEFLNSFRDMVPTTTVVQWERGETKLVTLEGRDLQGWLREYSLGSLFKSGELENMASESIKTQ
ncbi:MAG: AAA family ATPase [Chloroflexi bacterium]|nr:AAA family ATPase [Chloroflexota bacterium]